MTDRAIGGYFGRETVSGQGFPWLRGAARLQSARAALAALLRSARPSRVWIPHFSCPAMDDAAHTAGVEVVRYALDDNWGVPLDVELDADDWLVCIDYFGLCSSQVRQAVSRFGPGVVVAASQSLFFRPEGDENVVYSPRKFAGLPDGGLLRTRLHLPTLAPAAEQASSDRTVHLALRAEGQVAAGYAKYLESEQSLADCEPQAMSRLTQELLDSLDPTSMARRRIENYQLLSSLLANAGIVVRAPAPGEVPLCLPLQHVDSATVRQNLAESSIFCPRYWPGINPPDDDPVGRHLLDQTLYLPCDQRYGPRDMQVVADSVIPHLVKP